MEILKDSHGVEWELHDIGEKKVRLRNKRDWDNMGIYSKQFIEDAIKSRLLERLPVEEGGG